MKQRKRARTVIAICENTVVIFILDRLTKDRLKRYTVYIMLHNHIICKHTNIQQSSI